MCQVPEHICHLPPYSHERKNLTTMWTAPIFLRCSPSSGLTWGISAESDQNVGIKFLYCCVKSSNYNNHQYTTVTGMVTCLSTSMSGYPNSHKTWHHTIRCTTQSQFDDTTSTQMRVSWTLGSQINPACFTSCRITCTGPQNSVHFC